MRFSLIVFLTFFTTTSFSASLVETLSQHASIACQKPNGKITKIEADKIANCFVNTDSWQLNLDFDHLATSCTENLGFTCRENFIDAGAYSNTGNVEALSEGNHNISGKGADSKRYIVVPDAKIYINVSGHSKVYYLPSLSTKCYSSGSPYSSCRNTLLKAHLAPLWDHGI